MNSHSWIIAGPRIAVCSECGLKAIPSAAVLDKMVDHIAIRCTPDRRDQWLALTVMES